MPSTSGVDKVDPPGDTPTPAEATPPTATATPPTSEAKAVQADGDDAVSDETVAENNETTKNNSVDKAEKEAPGVAQESVDAAAGEADQISRPKQSPENDEGEGADSVVSTPVDKITRQEKAKDQTVSPVDTEPSIANSKSAQLLMNRFSTWREKTTENAQSFWSKKPSLQENAKALWMQAPTLPAVTRLAARANGGSSGKEQSAEEFGESTDIAADQIPSPPEGSGSFSTPDSGFVAGSNLGVSQDEQEQAPAASSDDIDGGIPGSAGPSEPKRVIVGEAVSKVAAAAASVVAESVATNFRGRYSASKAVETNAPSALATRARNSPESQTALILKSRVARHMQQILDSLEDHEFAMLLGNGMLGVNLKQCYLKNHGVFVDFLVAGGQAQLSGVIRTGDLLVRLGDVDLRKGTIAEIPQTIANTKRPVVLILATGTKLGVERMNFVDVAVALMHRAREFNDRQETNSRDNDSNLNSEEAANEAESGEESKGSASTRAQSSPATNVYDAPSKVSTAVISTDVSVQNFMTPPAPTLALCKAFVGDTALRCYDKFSVPSLCELSAVDANFHAAVENAFLSCALDSRRLPFLARHLSSEDDLTEVNHDCGRMTPSAHLMLFLELTSFLDLYGVTPGARLRDIASRIAHKFFLPTKVGDRLQPPLFDFHNIVPDASLRHLEFVLGGNSASIPRDLFFDFQKAVLDFLTGSPFLSFLASSECSRMRGYLRNTANYVNLPLSTLFDAVVGGTKHSGAKNCFAFMLIFLLSQLEKEQTGEHDFTEGENARMLGAASGLCCALFIRRSLIPNVEKARKHEGEKQREAGIDLVRETIQTYEKFWNEYLAPGIGALDIFSKSVETETAFKTVRAMLEESGRAAHDQGKDSVETSNPVVDSLLDPKLSEAARHLADELLYDYAVNVHTKFREHKCHEWLCSELSKMRAGDPTWSNTEELPVLPQGCMKRLLRKTELPAGVSSHKPYKAQAHTGHGIDNKEREHEYPNADYAVVFGTSVGADLAAQMPIPGIENSDIRRYACHPVALDREQEYDQFSEDPVPATFESYAVASQTKRKPLVEAADTLAVSADGWVVSLVNFMIPNAESSSGDAVESALFGVSLVFQRNYEDGEGDVDMKTRTVLEDTSAEGSEECNKGEDEEAGIDKEETSDKHGLATNSSFASPIKFGFPQKSSPDDVASVEGSTEVIRKIKLSLPAPILNQRLQERSWVDRALENGKALTIGVALVSRRNVVLAMRDSLSSMLLDYSRCPNQDGSKKAPIVCRSLVEVLGAFSHQDVESTSLRCLLEPYLRAASAPWLERPILDQKIAFEASALKQFTHCLTPTPLALLFVTVLLEQKIVFSSSRRSILHAASAALVSMLRPLKWSHLFVPLVPAALANDLIQYPAPFILGVPSEDAGNMDLLNNLPSDVTLVDLDVGRVILAPAFALNNEMASRSDDVAVTARALRSQVLYLAQALGSIFGNILCRESWCCDSPSPVGDSEDKNSKFDDLRSIAHGFVSELLTGVTSCCYWLEEATQGYGVVEEPTVLFDEDRFLHVKNMRATKKFKPLFQREKSVELALSLDDFDLVVESFLRCQSMSTYISSRDRTEMVYY